MLQSWLKSAANLRPSRPESKRARSGGNHPRVEILEDRTLMTTTLAVGPNVNISKLGGNQVETTISINPTNPRNLFASETFTAMARYSTDGGISWTNSNMAALPATIGDVQTAWDSFGNLFITRFGPSQSIVIARSADGGATFTDVRTPLASGGDQPSIAVGAGSVWMTVTNSSNQVVATGAAVTGLGLVGPFSALQIAPGPGGDFGDIAISPTGQVLVVYQNNGSGSGPDTIKANLDPDGLGPLGFNPVTFPTTTNVGGFDFIPAQPGRSVDAEANLAWDRSGGPNNGRVYLVYTDETPNESNNTEIMVRFSNDNGTTWSAPVRANDDATTRSQFNPAIAVDQTTGNVAVTWYDARNSAGNNTVQIFGTMSIDGGATFLANVQISAGTSNGTVAAVGSFNFGDYDKMDFVGGVFYRGWADNSNSTGDNPSGTLNALDMYTAAVYVTGDTSLQLFSNEPTIAVNPFNSNNVVAANYNQGFQTLKISLDGGASFPISVNAALPAGETFFDGDDSLAFDANGRLFWAYLTGHGGQGPANVVVQQVNPLTGAFVGAPTFATPAIGNLDKEWIAADSNPVSPFTDNVYVVWTDFNQSNAPIRFARSIDHGVTWTTMAGNVSGAGEGFTWPPEITVGRNGDVWVAWHTNTGSTTGEVRMRRSTDGGVTFGPEIIPFPAGTAATTRNQDSGLANKITGLHVWLQGSMQPRILVDPVRPGTIYVVSVDDPDTFIPTNDPSDIVLARSTNFGATWTRSTISQGIYGDSEFMPAAAIDVSGNIAVSWYDNRRHFTVPDSLGGTHYLLDLFTTTSTDSGATFSAPSRLNDVPFDPERGAPDRFGNHTLRIGEYNGLAIGDTKAHAVWTGNTSTGQQVIYDNFAMPKRIATANVTTDNTNWGFTVTGAGWTALTGAGFNNNYRRHANGVGESATNVARYVYAAPFGPGSYEIFGSWPALASNTDAAVIRIYDGSTFLAICTVNQKEAPVGITIGATQAQSLGIYTTTTGVFRVEISSLTTGVHDGDVVADVIFDPPVNVGGHGRTAIQGKRSATSALAGLLLTQTHQAASLSSTPVRAAKGSSAVTRAGDDKFFVNLARSLGTEATHRATLKTAVSQLASIKKDPALLEEVSLALI